MQNAQTHAVSKPTDGLPTRLFLALLALAAIHHRFVVMISGGVFTPSHHGMIFNSMALHLLEGRFDIDPSAVGDEAFVRDGRTFAYFGVLPALLRMPLVPFVDLATTDVEGFYRLVAMGLGSAGAVWLVRLLLARMPAAAQGLGVVLLLAVLFSGPVTMIGARSDVFNEVALWGWAIATWFLALLLPALDPSKDPSGRRLSGLAVLAGCAVLTRPTIGLGLLIALALLMLVLAWRQGGGRPFAGLFHAACKARFIAPALIALTFLAAAGGVNHARWGNPLTFADVSLQVDMLAFYPDRRDRLETYGLFNIRRLGLGLIYYFVPIWAVTRDGRFIFHDDIKHLFDAFELPPSSFFLSDPLTMAIAAIGLVALLRHRVPGVSRGPALAVLAGLSVPPVLMLMAWYMAFRYRVEFMPLFLLLASFGALRIGHWMAGATEAARQRAMRALVALLILQIFAAHAFALLYRLSPWGPSWRLPPGGLAAYYGGLFGP